MTKTTTFLFFTTFALPFAAQAQQAQLLSTPTGATLTITHDGDVDTTTCSSSDAGVYCHSYTTTVEASLISDALEKMLPADTYEAGRESFGALQVLPDALEDSMRETCKGLGFWKQRRDPYCNPMAQIEAAMQMTTCLGSKTTNGSHSGTLYVSEYTCANFYGRAYQQYVKNLKRGENSRGYPVIHRLKTRDEVLWEYAPVFLPLQLLGASGGRGTIEFDALKRCLARFENAGAMRQDDRCIMLYNRAVDAFNSSHQGSALSYTKVVPNYRPTSVRDCQAQTQGVSELMECFRQFDERPSSLPSLGDVGAPQSVAPVDPAPAKAIEN